MSLPILQAKRLKVNVAPPPRRSAGEWKGTGGVQCIVGASGAPPAPPRPPSP